MSTRASRRVGLANGSSNPARVNGAAIKDRPYYVPRTVNAVIADLRQDPASLEQRNTLGAAYGVRSGTITSRRASEPARRSTRAESLCNSATIRTRRLGPHAATRRRFGDRKPSTAFTIGVLGAGRCV